MIVTIGSLCVELSAIVSHERPVGMVEGLSNCSITI